MQPYYGGAIDQSNICESNESKSMNFKNVKTRYVIEFITDLDWKLYPVGVKVASWKIYLGTKLIRSMIEPT